MTDAPTTRETADHAELARLAEAATQGEWSAWISGNTISIDNRGGDGKLPAVVNWPGFDGNDMPKKTSKANARFIAAANPATVLALLSEIAALHGDLYETRIAADLLVASIRVDLSQAECQRDEAVGLLRDMLAAFGGPLTRRALGGHDERQMAVTIATRAFLANQGAE